MEQKKYRVNYKKITVCLILLVVLAFSFLFFNNGKTINAGQVTIFIDPGHGGGDTGCIQNGYLEKNINLSIALRVKNILESNGYRVIMRRTNDTGMSMDDIVNTANASGANLFISIHCNSSLNSAIQGIETYWSSSNTSGGSSQLATSIHSAVVQASGRTGRVLRSAEFIVIKYTTMPAALVECAFLSNPDEAALLNSEDYQNRVAQGIVNGIHSYVNSAGISGNTTVEANTGESLNGNVLLNVDVPSNNQTVSGILNLQGWTIDKSATNSTGITAVHVYDGPANGQANFIGQATYGIARPDVANSFGKANLALCGFKLPIDTGKLAKGTHVLYVYANNEAVGWKYATVTINVVNDGSTVTQTQTTSTVQSAATTTQTTVNADGSYASSGSKRVLVNIDSPKNNENITGRLKINGWALETSAQNSTGITAVHIYDGPANGQANFIGQATYGIARPDVANSLGGRAGFTNCGFTADLDISRLSAGQHDIYVYANNYYLGWQYAVVKINIGGTGTTSQAVSASGSNQSVKVAGISGANSQTSENSGSGKVLINVDTPKADQSINSAFTLSGWALETSSTDSAGITAVHIYDGPANGESNFLAAATYGITRPDVAAYYGKTNFTNCGFSANLNLSKLANGTHTLYVYANNPVTGWKCVTLKINITSSSSTGGSQSAGQSTSTSVSGGTNIIGYIPVSVDQLLRPFVARGSGQIDRARRLADLYIKWGQAFNIRADIAWAQMCHETGCLEFTGVAKPEWNNFAGVGITGSGAVVTFASEELGVIAHYAHLAWYVYPNDINAYCNKNYDPRHIGSHRFNGDSSLNCLSSRWATAADYINKIVYFANQIWG